MVSSSTDERTGTARTGDELEVAVVGAGQAGLALGYILRRQGRRFVILERADSIGPAWRARWESLTLFTPRRYSALPGLPFPGDPDGYPTRDEVIAYLDRYAEIFELPIELNSEVTRLERVDGRFRLEVGGRTMIADQVVAATGPFQVPYVPELAEQFGDDVFQTHAVGYRRPDDVPEGTILVVGGGNTGFQIAKELSRCRRSCSPSARGRSRCLSVCSGAISSGGSRRRGILDKTVDTRLGRKLRTRDTLIGSSPRRLRKRHGVELKPRIVDADGRTARFEDGSELEVDAVIWATGYRADYAMDRAPRLRRGRGAYVTVAASPRSPASCSSDSPGSTRGARR